MNYLSTHSPYTDGVIDPKHTTFIISGNSVCRSIWLAVLDLSLSRFYREITTEGGYISPQKDHGLSLLKQLHGCSNTLNI